MSPDRLTRTFAALADPTRRAILARLTSGEASVTELAEPFNMSLPAVSKHLKVLERAGLIARGRQAQWRPARLEAGPLKEVADWVERYRRFWEESFERLDDYLQELQSVVGCRRRDESAGSETGQTNESADAPRSPERNDMHSKVKGNYASVNGLNMYYEIHGTGQPLVLLHGALSAIETSFGKVLPSLAKTRQVIAIEQQAHGHTADTDRPLTYEHMADDTAALLRHIGIEHADIFGYSMGSAIALQIAIRQPDLVRKLVVATPAYNREGFHPGMLEGIETLKPEDLAGSPWQEEYARTAPNPEHWPTLIAKVKQLDREFEDWPPETIQSIKAPTLVMIGDSDVVRPEHAVEMFRLLGGGVAGDVTGLPNSQLAVLPGTTHVTLVDRADWLLSMITAFLDAPMPERK
jgi:pimeloyl-ACP methyl ester carboxylesterase/DNA-binding transcriptional ArsR family regulator